MKSYQFFTTDQYFDDLNFHDCLIYSIQENSNELVIELDLFYISEKHPLNPYANAKSTDQCRLTFKEVSLAKAEIYMDNTPQPIADYLKGERESKLATKSIHTSYLIKMEIESFEIEKRANESVFNLQGLDWKSGEFCGLIVHATEFTLEWNEFLEDAWYVGFEEGTKS